ncbi:MAG: recombinase family protein [Pseudomonadota bacterium]
MIRVTETSSCLTFAPSLKAPADRTGRLIGYARVSTDDQRLDMQLDALQRAGCAPIFYDHGVSGGESERPGLSEALRHLVEGDTLVVYKLDRLGRSVLHLADLITRLDNESVQFCSLTEGIDTTTAGGKLVYHVFAAVAEFSRTLIRENTCAGIEAARGRGVRIGRPPLLSDADVLEAHRFMHQDGATYRRTAERFGVSESTLHRSLGRLGNSL